MEDILKEYTWNDKIHVENYCNSTGYFENWSLLQFKNEIEPFFLN